jgi:hypothetical protein
LGDLETRHERTPVVGEGLGVDVGYVGPQEEIAADEGDAHGADGAVMSEEPAWDAEAQLHLAEFHERGIEAIGLDIVAAVIQRVVASRVDNDVVLAERAVAVVGG